jgi:hypothetical protein
VNESLVRRLGNRSNRPRSVPARGPTYLVGVRQQRVKGSQRREEQAAEQRWGRAHVAAVAAIAAVAAAAEVLEPLPRVGQR